MHKCSLSSHPRQHFLLLVFFCNSHFNRCEVLSHHDFNLHFPDNEWYWTSFCIPLGHLYVFFGNMTIQFLCSLTELFVLLLSCMSCLYILDINTLSDMSFANIFPIVYVACSFGYCFFCCGETFQFDVIPLVDFCFCCISFWCHIQKVIAETKSEMDLSGSTPHS